MLGKMYVARHVIVDADKPHAEEDHWDSHPSGPGIRALGRIEHWLWFLWLIAFIVLCAIQ